MRIFHLFVGIKRKKKVEIWYSTFSLDCSRWWRRWCWWLVGFIHFFFFIFYSLVCSTRLVVNFVSTFRAFAWTTFRSSVLAVGVCMYQCLCVVLVLFNVACSNLTSRILYHTNSFLLIFFLCVICVPCLVSFACVRFLFSFWTLFFPLIIFQPEKRTEESIIYFMLQRFYFNIYFFAFFCKCCSSTFLYIIVWNFSLFYYIFFHLPWIYFKDLLYCF